jgi:hypothetical protein
MVGKVNPPPDADEHEDAKSSAAEKRGLTAIDEERAASMADEGGAAGSTVESQERAPEPARTAPSSRPAGRARPTSKRGSTPRERKSRG